MEIDKATDPKIIKNLQNSLDERGAELIHDQIFRLGDGAHHDYDFTFFRPNSILLWACMMTKSFANRG